MPKRNEIDEKLAKELSGSEKISALLRARSFSYASFAREHGFWPEQVKHTIYGVRPYPEIRDALAVSLGLPRTEIDRLLDEATPPKAIADAA